jgi:hypothetical protein
MTDISAPKAQTSYDSRSRNKVCSKGHTYTSDSKAMRFTLKKPSLETTYFVSDAGKWQIITE